LGIVGRLVDQLAPECGGGGPENGSDGGVYAGFSKSVVAPIAIGPPG
jgi:hypothetical protein